MHKHWVSLFSILTSLPLLPYKESEYSENYINMDILIPPNLLLLPSLGKRHHLSPQTQSWELSLNLILSPSVCHQIFSILSFRTVSSIFFSPSPLPLALLQCLSLLSWITGKCPNISSDFSLVFQQPPPLLWDAMHLPCCHNRLMFLTGKSYQDILLLVIFMGFHCP